MCHPIDIKYELDKKSRIPIHLFRRKGMPIFVRLLIKAGAQYDKKFGIAHFLEHLLVLGTKKFPTKVNLAEYVEACGGQMSLSTDSDFIRINVEIADQEDLDVAITAYDEVLNHPLLLESKVEKERNVIFTEYQSKKSDQKKLGMDAYKRLFFQGTPYSNPIIGIPSTISTITRSDLCEHKKNYFLRENMTFVIGGDIDIDVFSEKITNILPEQESKHTELNIHHRNFLNRKYDLEIHHSNQAFFIAGFRTGQLNLKERICLDIFASYMGGGRASRLMDELRYKMGLVYDISCSNLAYLNDGVWIVKTSCDYTVLSKVLEIMIKVIQKELSGDMGNKIDYIKQKISKSVKIKMQTAKSWVEQNEIGLLKETPVTIEDYFKMLKEITVNEVMEVVNNYFVPNNFYIAGCGQEKMWDAISAVKFE